MRIKCVKKRNILIKVDLLSLLTILLSSINPVLVSEVNGSDTDPDGSDRLREMNGTSNRDANILPLGCCWF